MNNTFSFLKKHFDQRYTELEVALMSLMLCEWLVLSEDFRGGLFGFFSIMAEELPLTIILIFGFVLCTIWPFTTLFRKNISKYDSWFLSIFAFLITFPVGVSVATFGWGAPPEPFFIFEMLVGIFFVYRAMSSVYHIGSYSLSKQQTSVLHFICAALPMVCYLYFAHVYFEQHWSFAMAFSLFYISIFSSFYGQKKERKKTKR